MRRLCLKWIASVAVLIVFCITTGLRLCAQNIPSMPLAKACETLKALLPTVSKEDSTRARVTSAVVTPTGFTLGVEKHRDIVITWTNIQRVTDDQARSGDLVVYIRVGEGFTFEPRFANGAATAAPVTVAMQSLIAAANTGLFLDCTRDNSDLDTELESFSKQTADWRALSVKPALSDAVEKKRLLAEDAFQTKDFLATARHYNQGVALYPEWAQGWYNLGFLYDQLNMYWDAAYCMKHYLILLPNAPDAAAVREKVLLWEAKAEDAEASMPVAPSAPPPPKPSAKQSIMQGMWPGMQPK